MKLKKLLALCLCLLFAVSVFAACKNDTDADKDNSGNQDGTSVELYTTPYDASDWSEFDALVAEIKAETDFVKREELMHKAEDILMGTGAVMPIYYYNDIYMMKDTVEGFYANVYGTKFFMYTTNGDSTTLRINLASEPDRLDPALNSSVDGACLAANSFSGLYTYNAEGEAVPDLCESYTVSEDGLTYTFTLKDNLKWSDGTELTAKDFEYSWKRAANPETAADYSYMFSGIAGYNTEEGINVTASEDGKTLTVVLSAPCAYMLDLCAFPTFFPVKQSEVESAEGYLGSDGKILDAGAWAIEAGFVSNGAYVLESWSHDESMVYVKNPYYHNADKVKIERLEFMLSADDTAIFAAYEAGNLDFIDTAPNDKLSELQKRSDFYKIDQLGTYYVSFNVNSDLFEGLSGTDASKLRMALSLLVDRDYIIETCGQTGQQIATTFVPAGMLNGHGGVFRENDDAYTYPVKDAVGYFPEGSDQDELEQNREKAIAILKELGYKFDSEGKLTGDKKISFEYLVNEDSGHKAIAECMQQDFKKVGIDMSIKTIDWDTFLEERKAGNYDIARNGWIADFNDPINFLELFISESGNNDCQFGK